MWSQIAEKSYSYSHDDTMTDTFVKAEIKGDDRGNLQLIKSVNKKSPYIKGGYSNDEQKWDVGTVAKPELRLIVKNTSTSSSYYKFPKNWTSWNRKQGAISDIIREWANEKGLSAVTKSGKSEDQVRKLVIDKINSLNGADLDKIRRVLHIASKTKKSEDIKSGILKIANDLWVINMTTITKIARAKG